MLRTHNANHFLHCSTTISTATHIKYGNDDKNNDNNNNNNNKEIIGVQYYCDKFIDCTMLGGVAGL